MLAQITIYVPFIRTVNAVVRLHQQPQKICATISALYQCVKKCSQCVVIKFLNKTFANFPRYRQYTFKQGKKSHFIYFTPFYSMILTVSSFAFCFVKKRLSHNQSRSLPKTSLNASLPGFSGIGNHMCTWLHGCNCNSYLDLWKNEFL